MSRAHMSSTANTSAGRAALNFVDKAEVKAYRSQEFLPIVGEFGERARMVQSPRCSGSLRVDSRPRRYTRRRRVLRRRCRAIKGDQWLVLVTLGACRTSS